MEHVPTSDVYGSPELAVPRVDIADALILSSDMESCRTHMDVMSKFERNALEPVSGCLCAHIFWIALCLVCTCGTVYVGLFYGDNYYKAVLERSLEARGFPKAASYLLVFESARQACTAAFKMAIARVAMQSNAVRHLFEETEKRGKRTTREKLKTFRTRFLINAIIIFCVLACGLFVTLLVGPLSACRLNISVAMAVFGWALVPFFLAILSDRYQDLIANEIEERVRGVRQLLDKMLVDRCAMGRSVAETETFVANASATHWCTGWEELPATPSKLQTGCFDAFIFEFLRLDVDLNNTCRSLFVFDALTASYNLAFIYYAILALQFKAKWAIAFATVALPSQSYCLFQLIARYAQITALVRTYSTKKAWHDQSIQTRAIQLGAWVGQDGLRDEWMHMMQILAEADVGASFPMIGVVHMSSVAYYGRIFAAVIPIMIAWSVKELQ